MSNQGVSSSISCWKYDVFLSFRGEDTRKNFTDHLYAALKRAGIHVFRDDNELDIGKEIPPALLKAIEESRFSIIVFSRNYASSTWCLDELVKIIECKNSRNQTIIPIFYDVEPSTVRNQSGTFEEAFVDHENVGQSIDKVEKWKTALTEAANISGWHSKEWYESELVEEIAQKISSTLSISKYSSIKGLVGLDSRLKKLKMLIDTRPNEVRMIGICGMGGIGKTTIARAIFELISGEFEGSSFVANVRENSKKNGVVSLQKQLLSEILTGINITICSAYDGISKIKRRLQYKKVLIVLDDMDHEEQLNKFAENCDWFGSGSRIIITTRDGHLLKVHRVHEIYEVEKLNVDEGYQLFSLKAFNEDQPSGDFLDLSKHFVQYASGLPLALKVLGSHLCGRTIDEWRSALDRLKSYPEDEILGMLQISFDGLKEIEKKIFLDIACFFKGEEEDCVKRILDGCDFHYDIGVAVLIDKCLITRSKTHSKTNILWMHDLLQEMGHQIVKRGSPKEPGNRSRLWKEEDIKHVLTKNTGTEAVEAIMLETELNLSVSAKAFLNMTNLRLLKIINVNLPEGLEYLSNELRLLVWHGYSLKYLPSSFQPEKSLELDLCNSPIEQLWKRTRHLNMLMLTSITLEDCQYLKEIPNLMWAPNLVELSVRRCPRLLGIHSPSLLVHEKLKSLRMHDCTSLMTLPGKIHMESLEDFWIDGCPKLKKFPEIHMESLRYFLISHCPKLKKFPEIAGRIKNLTLLHFCGTAFREMPSSFELLTRLRYLDLYDNKSLVTLPSAIDVLKGLQRLGLSRCPNLISLPSAINNLKSLQDLLLSNCSNLESLPSTINGLQSLENLDLHGCSNLRTLPDTINGLTSLKKLVLSGCSNLESLPSTINGLQSLFLLDLRCCSKLENVPETLREVASLRVLDLGGTAITQPVSSIFSMMNLITLKFNGCKGPPSKSSYLNFLSPLMPRKNPSPMALMLPTSSDLCSLTDLDLSDCNLEERAIHSSFFTSLLSLEHLTLSRNNFLSLPTSIKDLQKLVSLDLNDCKNLQAVPELPSGVCNLQLNGCASLETLSDAFKSLNSEHLSIYCINCLKLIGDEDFILPVVEAFLKVSLYLRGGDNFFHRHDIVFPGADIPNWVLHQSKGSSIGIERPPDSYNNNKLVGFILCSVFVVDENLRGYRCCITRLVGRVKTDVDEDPKYLNWIDINEKVTKYKSEHIWLYYLPHDHKWIFQQDKYNHIYLSFEPEYTGFPVADLSFEVEARHQVEVKRCGIHPIYEQDLINFKPLANQPTVDVAATSGNLPSYDDEEPQPKRFKSSASQWQNLSLSKYVK